MIYRVFWNLNAGPQTQWCIDNGPGTTRRWVADWICIKPTRSGNRPEGRTDHPRGWVEVNAGSVRIGDDNVAYFS